MRQSTITYIFYFVLLTSCSNSTYETIYPTLSDGKYDSEFPYRNCSEQLKSISKSAKKISSVVFYNIYEFDISQQVTKDKINTEFLKNNSIKKDIFSESIVGTATIIYKDLAHVALLTCAHIINFQDTIISHFELSGTSKYYIKTITIKKQQQHYIPDLILGEKFEVIAIDIKNDIAILGLETEPENIKKAIVFPYPAGKSNKLEWGSFVYIMGYPLGLQMITRGIVSRPAKNKNDSFLIDAVFNHGFSGGLVLAIKDGVPNFELVGIAKSASANYENYLVPEISNGRMTYSQNLPYEGPVFVEAKESINYGITFSITMETLQAFYRKNKTSLLSKGYNLSDFFEN